MTRLVTEIVESGERWSNVLLVTGVRTPAEAKALKTHFGPDLLLVHVKVGDLQTRYQRVKARDYSRDPDDFHSFVGQDEALKESFSLTKTADLADTTLRNDGSLQNFRRQIEDQLVPHLFPKPGEFHDG